MDPMEGTAEEGSLHQCPALGGTEVKITGFTETSALKNLRIAKAYRQQTVRALKVRKVKLYVIFAGLLTSR